MKSCSGPCEKNDRMEEVQRRKERGMKSAEESERVESGADIGKTGGSWIVLKYV